MLARDAYRVPDLRGGGPQGGRNNGRAHRGGPGRVEVQLSQARKNDRQSVAAQTGNTGRLGARPCMNITNSRLFHLNLIIYLLIYLLIDKQDFIPRVLRLRIQSR